MLQRVGAPKQVGPQLYLAVSIAALLYALVAGVLLTADAIPGERSRGTLGLLFLTDLRPPDILLGKLAANSVGGAYVLVGLLPILGVLPEGAAATASGAARSMA